MRGLWLSVLLLSGCNYNHVKQAAASKGLAAAENADNPDFKTVQMAVIGPRCLGCHSVAGGNQGGTNLETFDRLHSLSARIGYRALEKRDMPPRGPLSEDEARLLDAWIKNGAVENVPVGAQKPDPSLGRGPNDWAKIRDKIFAKKCNDCHSGSNAAAALDLSDIHQARAKALQIFDRVILKGDMPVAPYPAVTPVERVALEGWFNLGMPE